MDSNIENQLIMILSDLNRVEGIDSSLIADNNGAVICHNMSRGTDTSLFGPMAHVITSSSKRLLNSANGGEIQRVLVESHGGKALFLHLENTYFIVLMEISANVGLVMVSAKRAAQEIIKLTKDIVPIEPVEEEVTVASNEINILSKEEKTVPDETSISSEGIKIAESEAVEKPAIDKIEVKELDVETVDKIIETEDLEEAAAKVIGTEKLDEILESKEFKDLDTTEAEEKLSKMLEIETKEMSTTDAGSDNTGTVEESKIVAEGVSPEIEETDTESESKVEEIEESGNILPVIKPPISFPELPENVKIPSGNKEKSDLILDIYESIFLAMSIGASKIMGVAPARGLIKQFLPLEDCKSLLKGVDVKSNSVVDFDKIRENAENIPLNERENTLITDFNKIISIITENYGKVMGYGAFRGMVRTEFKTITTSYGNAMAELGIKDKINPELIDLFK